MEKKTRSLLEMAPRHPGSFGKGGVDLVVGRGVDLRRRDTLKLAAGLAPMLLAAPAIAAPAAIGRATSVADARLVQESGTVRPLLVGNAIHQHDRIVTGAGGNAKLLFDDGTQFSIGPRADLTLDRFAYDPAMMLGRFSVRVAVGAFRFLSGAIADVMADAMEEVFRILTPVAAIGIRGTHVLAIVEPSETGCIVLLPDPRPGRESSAMTVTSAGRTVIVDEPGWGTDVKDATSGPTEPQTWPAARVAQMRALSGP